MLRVVVISRHDVTSRRGKSVENPGVSWGMPGAVCHEFVDDMFYEAGDSWTPSSAPHNKSNVAAGSFRRRTPTDKGSLENVKLTF